MNEELFEKHKAHISQIAQSLPNAKLDEIKTRDYQHTHRANKIYVMCGSNVYLEVMYSVSKQSVISIGCFHPRHKHFCSVNTINISLKKSHNRIVSDITSRLLDNFEEAKAKFDSYEKELKKAKEKTEARDFVLRSIKMVSTSDWVEQSSCKEYLYKEVPIKSERAREILKRDTSNEHVATVYHHSDHIDRFDLDLRNIPAEKVIQVLALLNY
ncbi:hypothetical protein SL034_004310 [Vibrio harveyi]|uniref:hypothetical protein n=1 Tax=Vibrio harveyi group TaxID=717610 RepID=UPI000971A711|nr:MULTISPECIES: hypothetical protein [Vibrio harveyi group]APX10078.1 hypothetical protein BWP24_28220 [Vibrio campbellii]ELY1989222.1 hypothetical protein [Vibrio harveyi]WCP78845.1 hypothetical protein PPW95_25420 [Vibrio parahaemolyticus]